MNLTLGKSAQGFGDLGVGDALYLLQPLSPDHLRGDRAGRDGGGASESLEACLDDLAVHDSEAQAHDVSMVRTSDGRDGVGSLQITDIPRVAVVIENSLTVSPSPDHVPSPEACPDESAGREVPLPITPAIGRDRAATVCPGLSIFALKNRGCDERGLRLDSGSAPLRIPAKV